MRVLLTAAYDGTDYAGWQRQANAVSVQQRLEEALSSLLGHTVKTAAASRTDAGVHALGQRVCFSADALRVPLDKLPQVLNALLPNDIAVSAAREVPEGFNPRHAVSKTYRYQFYNAPCPDPLLTRYSAFVPQALRVGAMREAAAFFVGRHDFAGFCAAGSSARTTARTVFSCEVRAEGSLLRMFICGEGFLYNMARIVAGTLLYAGLGKVKPEEIPDIIASGDRTRAGKTMPPAGLTLMEVRYE
jgi:tRNA pseudouridine38-40 synthase